MSEEPSPSPPLSQYKPPMFNSNCSDSICIDDDCGTSELAADKDESNSDSEDDMSPQHDPWLPSFPDIPCVFCIAHNDHPPWQSREQTRCDGCGGSYCEKHEYNLEPCDDKECKWRYCDQCVAARFVVQVAYYNQRVNAPNGNKWFHIENLPHGVCVCCTLRYRECTLCKRRHPDEHFITCFGMNDSCVPIDVCAGCCDTRKRKYALVYCSVCEPGHLEAPSPKRTQMSSQSLPLSSQP